MQKVGRYMHRKKAILLIPVLVICFAVICGIYVYKEPDIKQNLNAITLKIENAIGDDFKRQSMTKLTDTLEYVNITNEENKIYFHTLKTTYCEAEPIEITGVNTNALNVLFPVDNMESCKIMKIQNWDAALYKKGETAYLCWTCSPELSYVLEYNPNLIDDSEIIKTAESARPK